MNIVRKTCTCAPCTGPTCACGNCRRARHWNGWTDWSTRHEHDDDRYLDPTATGDPQPRSGSGRLGADVGAVHVAVGRHPAKPDQLRAGGEHALQLYGAAMRESGMSPGRELAGSGMEGESAAFHAQEAIPRRRLARGDRTLALELGPLEDAAIAQLVTLAAAQRPAPDAVDAIVHSAQGNPFFALELARSLGTDPSSPLPETVRAHFRAQARLALRGIKT